MDVGCWLLKTTSANLLKNCVSGVWGLLYSDGASVFLLPISSLDDQSYLLPKVQKLENVGLIHDIACSPGYQDGYFIAAITSSEAGIKVSVWRAREEEIGEPFCQSTDAFICGNPLPQGQGLSWHPFSNVLCTVCQNEAFVFSNDSKTGVLEKIKSFSGSERFTSCCWNYSGSLLIFATHSKLLFYNFTCDPDPCEPVFSFVIGKVCSLETVDQTRLLCAIELPISDVVRHQVETISHNSVEAQTTASNSLVGNSQLLLIGYNAVDGKPYIMAKMDIEEILTPNIMVYEAENMDMCRTTGTFYKLPITKITEMVLENGKVPKGIAISTFSNTKLLWLLSGQTCEDCTASLAIPDEGYVSCNMTFRVIALHQLLGSEKRFIVQEKDFASCFDRRNLPKSRHCSNHHLRLPDTLSSALPEGDTLPKALAEGTTAKPYTARRDLCEKAVEVHPEDLDADDKSVLSYYSAPDHHMPRRTDAGKVYEASNSLSHEDYYSMDRSNYSRGSTHRGQAADKKIFDIERCVLEMFETHSTELNDIKCELKELKKVVSSISSVQPVSGTPTSAQLMVHVQELQHSIHLVENKLDVMTIDINSRMRHQDRKLSEIRKELSALKRV